MGGKTFKVHLDGVNLLPFLSGKEEKSPREGFLYWSDDGDLHGRCAWAGSRSSSPNSAQTGLDVWREPLSPMRIPKLFDLRADPFERGEESFKYNDWFVEHESPASMRRRQSLGKWLESFKEFPPRAEGRELQHRPGRREADAKDWMSEAAPQGETLRMSSAASNF